MDPEFEHDVALSFAGAQRPYVSQVAAALRECGAKVFYDKEFVVDMWGEDLNEYLQRIYASSRLVVMFVSKEYEESAFPTKERRTAFAAEMHKGAKVLPVRFDDTELPGLDVNQGYLRADEFTPAQVADAVVHRLAKAGVALRKPSPSGATRQPRPPNTSEFTINVHADGEPVTDAEIAVVSENGNIIRATARGEGQYACQTPVGRLMRVWVAHPDHPGHLSRDIDTATDLTVELGYTDGIASKVFFSSTGHLPSVKGRFNPVFDSNARLYVYIQNAAVNGRDASPHHFRRGVPFEVEDPDGSVTVVTFLDVTSNGSLLDYAPPPP